MTIFDDEHMMEQMRLYLRGEMTTEDKILFEETINSDSELALALKLMRLQKEGLEKHRENRFRGKMNQWDKENSDSPTRKSNWKLYVVLVLCVLGTFFYFLNSPVQRPDPPEMPDTEPNIALDSTKKSSLNPKTENENDTASTYFSPKKIPKKIKSNRQQAQKAPPVINGSELFVQFYEEPIEFSNDLASVPTPQEGADNFLEQGISAYQNKSYVEAFTLFAKIEKTDANTISYEIAQQWLGHAALQAGLTTRELSYFKKAEQVFRSFSVSLIGFEKSQAEWYFLLSMLPSVGKNEEAVRQLAEKILLENPDHPFKEKIKELMSKLDN